MNQLAAQEPLCTGCRTCELLCAFSRFGEMNPRKAALRVHGEFPAPGAYHLSLCTQCGECADACPSEAIGLDETRGAYVIDPELCTDCGVCVDACPENVMFTHREAAPPIKCDLCGECVEICPRGVLSVVDSGTGATVVAAGTAAAATHAAPAGTAAAAGAWATNSAAGAGTAPAAAKAALPGYAGTLLRVDLTAGTVAKEPLSEALAREYLGGRGFVANLLWDEVPAGADPLGPDNRVIMASGPLAGAFVPAGAKVEFGAKSPATGGYGDSNMGGHLAAEMKYAGYDVVVFQGASPTPVYLYIDDGRVELRDANKYWGQGSFATEKALKDDLGEDFQIATIGPAGENLVRYACISHDFGRQAGRTGIGAVLGSKKVKAVAVRGTRSFPAADPARVMKLGKEMFAHCAAAPLFKEWQDYGTASVTTWVNDIGCFPTRNFSTSYYEKFERFSGEVMRESIVVNDKACYACPLACGKYSHTKVTTASGVELEAHVEGPEYETTALVGGNCMLDSLEEVAYVNWVMDELGLDTISAGSTIAWALECLEKGLLTPEQVEGKELRFGDLESVLWLCEKIAKREGYIGDLLADGTRLAAAKVGGDSLDFAIQVKGLEMSGYDSRNATAMLLSYMTADIGAAHNRSWAVTHDLATERRGVEGKAAKVIELQHTRPMFDTLGVCRLQWIELGMPVERYAEMLSALTGVEYSWDDLLCISEKVFNLTRAFNAREIPDYGRAMDLPPARVWKDPVPTGPSAGASVPLETVHALLDDYYRLRGWTEDGLPTAAKLRELGLDDVAQVLGAG